MRRLAAAFESGAKAPHSKGVCYDAFVPRILVTNDDGIYSEGLRKLADALRPQGEVIIVAPDREQSAASHALTLNRPLRLLQLEENEWIVDGTPTDCVNLAVLKLMKDKRPDIVVSGINFGPNLGDDVTYSGTISAAFEGALLNIPSEQRMVIELAYFQGWTHSEIAAGCEIPLGTVKARMRLGLSRLRGLLAQMEVDEI